MAGPWTTPSGKTPGTFWGGSFRLGLLWQPSPSFRVVAKFDYNYVDNNGIAEDPSQVIDLTAPGFERPNPGSLFNVTDFTKTYAIETTYRASLNAAYTFGDGTILRSITSYQYGWGDGDVDLTIAGFGAGAFGGPPYFDSFADYGREEIYSEEVNLISPDTGPLRWVAGLFYQHDYVTLLPGGSDGRGNIGFDIGVPAGVFDEDLAYRTPKVTEAAFGQVSYDITSTLQLQVGARYTDETFGLRDTLFDQLFGVTLPGTVFNFVAHTSDSGLTGKVALNSSLNPTNFLYAFVATGSKAAGINTNPVGTQTAPVPFGTETVTDYEAGWKPTFFDGHLRAQVGGYYDQYQKFQLSFAVPSTAGNQAFIRNVSGTTTLYGIEAEMQAVFGPLSFDAGVSYEHSALGSALVDDPGPSATAGALVQLSGRPLPLAPDWTANFGGQYAFTLPNEATLTPRVDVSYISGQWGTPYEDIGDYVPAHTVVNVQIAYEQHRFNVTLFATNAFNEQYLIGSAGGLRYAGAPAQYGVRVEHSF
ncbi:MAG TPA: TonB-dependent receptor [Caulobacteraceae bacterium]|nr:TonB-dependent receptor [Caulobacteraceae bacterium]